MSIRMRFAVTGSTGLLGNALVHHLRQQGHEATRVVRPSTPEFNETVIHWDPQEGMIDREGFEGLDAVIHTAGANLAEERWSKKTKEKLIQSRVRSTTVLAAGLARLNTPPRALVSLSAAGYYGFSHGVAFTEVDGAGEDFLAQLCLRWEAAADLARQAGIRVVHPRLAVVLSPLGGALKKMFRPFQWGLGGSLGNGKQPFCWISLHDAVEGLSWLARNSEMEGSINLAAPQHLDNKAMTQSLAAALKRPAFFKLPAFGARWIFGDMADAALLSGQYLNVEKLLYAGFRFRHLDIDTAFSDLFDSEFETFS